MSLSTFQSDLAAVLATVPELAGVEVMLELDELATAEALAAQDAIFEREISRKGFVIVVSTPRAERLAAARFAGAVHLRLLCQVAFIENPTINRATFDPATPEITPANKRPLIVMRAAIAKFIGANFELPGNPITSPDQDLEGLNLHGLLVTDKDDIRAT